MKGGALRTLTYATVSSLLAGLLGWLAGTSPLAMGGLAGLMAFLLARSHEAHERARVAYEVSALAPFIIYEGRLVLLSTRSLFEVIRHVAEGGFRHVSMDFQKLKMRAIRGESPRRLLLQYASGTDSRSLREGLLQLLAEHEAGNMGLQPVEYHARTRFLEETEKLYPKLAVASAWFFFAPIILVVLLGATGRTSDTSLWGVLGLYLVFSLTLRGYLTRREASLVH